jgi:hypothetical protein
MEGFEDNFVLNMDEFGNTIMLDYRELGLTIKHQGYSYSCVSHSISTLLEAYFKRNRPLDYAAHTSWSSFDIHFCKQNHFTMISYQLALAAIKGKRIAADSCSHAKAMQLTLTSQCSERYVCPEDTAVVDDYGHIDHATTQSIIEALYSYGPLGILSNWGKEVATYTHFLSKNGPANADSNVIFYKQDWTTAAELYARPSWTSRIARWHAMVLVGYGYRPNGELFWIILNSYGRGMGHEGFIFCGEHELNFASHKIWYVKKAHIDAPLFRRKFHTSKQS